MNNRMSEGCDTFMPSPGTYGTMECGVCGETCDVKRDINGPTSWAGAMSGTPRDHDLFTCPNREKSWHIHALNLFKEMNSSFSPSLRRIMQQDFNEIIQEYKE
jgi:hypothetical protein